MVVRNTVRDVRREVDPSSGVKVSLISVPGMFLGTTRDQTNKVPYESARDEVGATGVCGPRTRKSET